MTCFYLYHRATVPRWQQTTVRPHFVLIQNDSNTGCYRPSTCGSSLWQVTFRHTMKAALDSTPKGLSDLCGMGRHSCASIPARDAICVVSPAWLVRISGCAWRAVLVVAVLTVVAHENTFAVHMPVVSVPMRSSRIRISWEPMCPDHRLKFRICLGHSSLLCAAKSVAITALGSDADCETCVAHWTEVQAVVPDGFT
jgi:hypothetical protein